MRPFEFLYLFAAPFSLPLYKLVRKNLIAIIKIFPGRPKLLDVGGRKSHYTIGLPADVTILDLPRVSQVQKQLNLGITQNIIDDILERRSNIKEMMFADMTCSPFGDKAFDCISAIEVLEHVEQDDLFIKEVYRVLKPRGVFFMTTPNGDFIANTNPDHRRHYTRAQLHRLLSKRFTKVEVEYAILDGFFRNAGLKSWSLKKPFQTVLGMLGNIINTVQSRPHRLTNRSQGTCHLVAIAVKE